MFKNQLKEAIIISKKCQGESSVREATCKGILVKLFMREDEFNGVIYIYPGSHPFWGSCPKFSYELIDSRRENYVPKKLRFNIKKIKYRGSDLNRTKVLKFEDRDFTLILKLNPDFYVHRSFAKRMRTRQKR